MFKRGFYGYNNTLSLLLYLTFSSILGIAPYKASTNSSIPCILAVAYAKVTYPDSANNFTLSLISPVYNVF